MLKTCSKCGETKPATPEYFSRHKGRRDGLNHYCKSCHRTASSKSNRRLVTDSLTGETIKAGALSHRRPVTDPISGETIRAGALSHRKRYQNGKHQEYMEANPLAKMRHGLACLIRSSMRKSGWSKTTKTQALLGCSFQEFQQHIENQFTDGMSWDNAGEWHYDHRIPCSCATTQEELEALFHWSNFQPMWGGENISKGAALPDGWALELRLLVKVKNT